MKVSTDEYDYYFRVCGTIAESCKSVDHTVSSCQVKKTNSTSRKIAGIVILEFRRKDLLLKTTSANFHGIIVSPLSRWRT